MPVAIDVGSVRQKWKFAAGTPNYTPAEAGTEEVQLFSAIERQSPMSQGIWLTTPAGKVLRESYHVNAGPMIDVMRLAVADWKKQGGAPPIPVPGRAKRKSVDAAADGSVRLAIHGRLLDGSDMPPFRDSVDFSADQLLGLLPEKIEPGSSIDVPSVILREFASRLYPGELRLAIRPEEVQTATAIVAIADVEDGIARAELEGQIEIDGVFPFSSRHRTLKARLAGEMSWQVQSRKLVALRIVSDGTWQAEYPPGVLPTVADIYPGGTMSLGPPVMSSPMRMLFLIEFGHSESADLGYRSPHGVRLANDD